MVLRMANPQKNKYGVYMYTVRVPTDLVQIVGRRVYSISLRTKDPNEARERFKAVAAEKDREHKALRGAPEAVPLATIVGMAGEVYREQRALAEVAAGPDEFEMMQQAFAARAEDANWLADIANAKLLERGLAGDPRTRELLVHELARAFAGLAREAAKMERGDFSPDQNLARYSAAKGPTLTRLLEGWETVHLANGKSKRTVEDYRKIVKLFGEFLGHDDASKVSRGQIKAFCNHLIGEKGLKPKTVNGRYLTCLKALFREAFDAELVQHNPAAPVRQKVAKKTRNRTPDYTDAEAKLILAIANRAMMPPADGSKDPRTPHLKKVGRWVPWVLCYTGARVAEITQLRKEDVQELDGIPFIRITPEAGSVKTGQYREVPLHPHLVEMGFLDFVRTSPDGPLFFQPNPNRRGTGITQAQWAGNELGRWLKKEMGDAWPNVQPNHAWRHRFATKGRIHGMTEELRKAIQGHGNPEAAADYGEMPLKAMYREVQKLPRVIVD